MATIKDRNGKDLTEAEVKKRWQEYTEESSETGIDREGKTLGTVLKIHVWG